MWAVGATGTENFDGHVGDSYIPKLKKSQDITTMKINNMIICGKTGRISLKTMFSARKHFVNLYVVSSYAIFYNIDCKEWLVQIISIIFINVTGKNPPIQYFVIGGSQ
jgi:hypothetical protein